MNFLFYFSDLRRDRLKSHHPPTSLGMSAKNSRLIPLQQQEHYQQPQQHRHPHHHHRHRHHPQQLTSKSNEHRDQNENLDAEGYDQLNVNDLETGDSTKLHNADDLELLVGSQTYEDRIHGDDVDVTDFSNKEELFRALPYSTTGDVEHTMTPGDSRTLPTRRQQVVAELRGKGDSTILDKRPAKFVLSKQFRKGWSIE